MDHGTIPDAVEATSKRALRIESGDIPSFTEARNQFEREYLTKVLQMTNGNVAKAARIAKRN